MLQYVLTALAGIMIGVAAMRVWQAKPGAVDEKPAPVEPALPESASPELASPELAQLTQTPLTQADKSKSRLAAMLAVRPSSRMVLLAAAAMVAVATGALALRSPDSHEDEGQPAMGDAATGAGGPGANPAANPAASGKQLADVDTMISHLADRLKANPNDGEGFRMLGWSYVMTGHPDQALAPYRRALSLVPDKAPVHEGYGEALVGVAQGAVTEEARQEFVRAVAINPGEPRARYFLAMWQAQHGQQRQALDKWIALSNEGPADAPWQGDVHHQIDAVAAKLGVDVSARLKARPAAAIAVPAVAPPAPAGALPALDPNIAAAGERMTDASRQEMVGQMVGRLAARLKTQPGDPDGWIALLRSRMVLHQDEQARGDLVTARRALAGTPADLARVETAARGLGVPGAR